MKKYTEPKQEVVPYHPGMTLMPGQSTAISLSLEIPHEIAQELQGHFEPVPPPKEAPVDPNAEILGLVRGLRVDLATRGQWRCGQCSQMQPNGSVQVWVPDSVHKNDPDWSVTEACRCNAYNGHFTAWCLECAPKAPAKPKEHPANAPQPSMVRRIIDSFGWTGR